MMHHDEAPRAAIEQMGAQLADLYADREKLHQALGVSDADDILSLVRSLEAQLDDFYRHQEAQA